MQGWQQSTAVAHTANEHTVIKFNAHLILEIKGWMAANRQGHPGNR